MTLISIPEQCKILQRSISFVLCANFILMYVSHSLEWVFLWQNKKKSTENHKRIASTFFCLIMFKLENVHFFYLLKWFACRGHVVFYEFMKFLDIFWIKLKKLICNTKKNSQGRPNFLNIVLFSSFTKSRTTLQVLETAIN